MRTLMMGVGLGLVVGVTTGFFAGRADGSQRADEMLTRAASAFELHVETERRRLGEISDCMLWHDKNYGSGVYVFGPLEREEHVFNWFVVFMEAYKTSHAARFNAVAEAMDSLMRDAKLRAERGSDERCPLQN